jgi:2-iminobutanoate/2-iminopropanoate deaminase
MERRFNMAKEIIKLSTTPSGFPPGIPPEIPLYSPGVRAGDYIFVTGQVGAVDDQGREVKGTEAQTRQLLENIEKILEAGGASLSDVVKTTNFLVNVEDWNQMNKAYSSYFPEGWPARSTVIVAGLSKPEWLVEIECIAYHPQPSR